MAISTTSRSDLGAGQLASIQNGAYLEALSANWGRPRFPLEPRSQAIARAQRDISRYRLLLWNLDEFSTDEARTVRERIEEDYWLMWDYVLDEMTHERLTEDSAARTAEEYEALMGTTGVRRGRIDYRELKARVHIEDYAADLTGLRKAGKTTLKGKCPLPGHEDDTPSFWVYIHNQSWYCFGCLRGGDVIDLAHAMGRDIR